MIAKYAGKCQECGGRFEAGESIVYSPDQGSRHTGCEPRGSREARSAPAAEPKAKPIRFSLVLGAPRVIIALKYATGKRMPPRYPGKPDQVLYTLIDDRVWYASLEEAAEVESLHVGAGEPFSVCALEAGQIRVERLAAPPANGAAARVPAPAAAPVARETAIPAGPVVAANGSSAPVGKVNGQGETLEAIMRRSYFAAIAVCLDAVAAAREQGLPVAPNFDSIERTAVSLFIGETRNG